MASVTLTPPWSAFDKKDYEHLATDYQAADYTQQMQDKYRWIEYHKWKFRSKTYTALTNATKCFVLVTRVEFGILGSYNKYKGVSYADTSDGSVFAGNLPIGAGIKYKMGARLNLGVEWAMHFSTSDKLDGVVDPYGIKSTGLFKNRDCFSALQLTLTYSFMAKCKTCNNDKDD